MVTFPGKFHMFREKKATPNSPSNIPHWVYHLGLRRRSGYQSFWKRAICRPR
jgi:hypothetical protein